MDHSQEGAFKRRTAEEPWCEVILKSTKQSGRSATIATLRRRPSPLHKRFREGEESMWDRSSRPHSLLSQNPAADYADVGVLRTALQR